MTYRVFISHSAPDRESVEAIRQAAIKVGVEPYIYEHDPRPGTMVAEKVQAEIRASHAMILLLTRHSATSPYVQQEVGFAIAAAKPVLPLIETGISEDRLAMLKGIEWVEFDPGSPASAVDALSTELERLRLRKEARDELALALGMVALMVLLIYLTSLEGGG